MNTFNDYNKFEQLPLMQYNIISYLMQNNENIWKLLQYPDNTALDKPNLSMADKAKLIFNGQSDPTTYRIFMTDFLADAFLTKCSIIRIFPEIIIPTSRVVANVNIRLEVLSHIDILQLNNYTTRNVQLMQQIISCLNGQNINGVGNLTFDYEGNRYDRAVLNISNNKSFTGYSILMSTRVG